MAGIRTELAGPIGVHGYKGAIFGGIACGLRGSRMV